MRLIQLQLAPGLRHWAKSFLAHDDRRDEAIVLIDPDFLFLNTFKLPPNSPPVIPGKPAGAKYGLGGQVRQTRTAFPTVVTTHGFLTVDSALFRPYSASTVLGIQLDTYMRESA